MSTSGTFDTMTLPQQYNDLAPDGSEIRLLTDMKGGGLAHCLLPPGATSVPVLHRHVDEMWYRISGQGDVWRRHESAEEAIQVRSGVALTVPTDTAFQFRNTGEEPLCFVIATMPPWPGESEAEKAKGKWEALGEG
jgi:mannose-6-phosphate isomerase-like protein (cupin superfamily)